MKKLLFYILAIFALVLLSCEKEPETTTGNITFYMTEKSTWTIYVNGVNKGNLKSTTQMPVCGDPIFLNMSLPVGTHSYQLKSGYASSQKTFVVKPGCQQIRCTP